MIALVLKHYMAAAAAYRNASGLQEGADERGPRVMAQAPHDSFSIGSPMAQPQRMPSVPIA